MYLCGTTTIRHSGEDPAALEIPGWLELALPRDCPLVGTGPSKGAVSREQGAGLGRGGKDRQTAHSDLAGAGRDWPGRTWKIFLNNQNDPWRANRFDW